MRWAETISTLWLIENCSQTSIAAFIVGKSESLPIMMPISGGDVVISAVVIFASKDVLEKLFRIESDIIRHVNQFLADLDGIKEGDGTLLDYTTVVLGSNFGDASNHTCSNLPTIVAGGGFHHKPHSVLERPTPLCNLWLEILNEHNVDVGRFGSGDQNLKLLAS